MSLHTRLRAAADIFDVALEPTFEFDSAEYQSLQERSATTAFQGSRWLATLYREVAPAFAAEPITVTVRERGTGRLMLVLPLVRRRANKLISIEFADFGVCDYLAPVCEPADIHCLVADATLPPRIWRLLAPFDVISLTKLPHEDPVLKHLFPNARRAHMRVSAHSVEWNTSWAEWRATKVNPSLRHELDIKRRRFAKAGKPAFALLKSEGEIAEAFDALQCFRAERFKSRSAADILDHPAILSFYRQVAIGGAQAGVARTYCMFLSSEPIAVMFGLAHRRTFSLLLIGFDLARYRRLSVGLLAIEDTLRASNECGDLSYDFTIGDYPFKVQFGAQSKPLHEWRVAGTIRGRLAVLAAEAVRETKRALKPLVTGARRRLTTTREKIAKRSATV
jgi:CelD/BcsL family acetyltransferase involved in cellulose biosynthesis